MLSLIEIFKILRKGNTPTEIDWKSIFSSVVHKTEKIPIPSIFGLNDALDKLDKEKTSHEDLANAGAGWRPMGKVETFAELEAKPKRDNDSYYVNETKDENNDPYIWRYDSHLAEWINTYQVVYKNVAKSGGSKKTLQDIDNDIVGISSPVSDYQYATHILRAIKKTHFVDVAEIQVTRLKNSGGAIFGSYIELKAILLDGREVVGFFRRLEASKGIEDIEIVFYTTDVLERLTLVIDWDKFATKNLYPENLLLDLAKIPLTDEIDTRKMIYDRGIESYNYTDIYLSASKQSSLSKIERINLMRIKNTALPYYPTYVEVLATLKDGSTRLTTFTDMEVSNSIRRCNFVFYIDKDITDIFTLDIDFSKVINADTTYDDFVLLKDNFIDETLQITTKSVNALGVQTFVPQNTSLLQKYQLTIDDIGVDEDLWLEGYLGANNQVYAGEHWYTWKNPEPVHPNSTITYEGWLSGNARILVLGSSNNIVKVIAATDNNKKIDIDIPSNGEFLRFCIRKNATATAPRLRMKSDYFYVKGQSVPTIDTGISNSTLKNNLKNQAAILPSEITTVGMYGADNCIYNIPIKSSNGIVRVKFDFKINENMHVNSEVYKKLMLLKNSTGSLANVFVYPIPTKSDSIAPAIISNFVYVLSYDELIHTSMLRFQAPSFNQHTGNDAFWLRSTLDPNNVDNQDVCVTNKDGIFKIVHSSTNTIISELKLSDYADMNAFYKALQELPNIECGFEEIMEHKPSELIEFENVKLIAEYTYRWGSMKQWDASRCYVPYAIDTKFHTCEMVVSDGKACVSIDGVTMPTINFDLSKDAVLMLGSDKLKCSLKNLHIDYNHTGEAEVVYYNTSNANKDKPKLISEYNPQVIIFEGHGIGDYLEIDGWDGFDEASEDDKWQIRMNAPIERLEYVFNYLNAKGYTPISIIDIVDWYAGKPLPSKRVYTIVMDDYRYENFMNLRFRGVFSKYGVKPALAWISDLDKPIEIDGQNYNKAKMLRLMQKNNWFPHSHTRDHRYLTDDKGSDLYRTLSEDIRSADDVEIYSQCITYPYGAVNYNVIKACEKVGFALGIDVVKGSYPELGRNKYVCHRLEIGIRSDINIVKANIL